MQQGKVITRPAELHKETLHPSSGTKRRVPRFRQREAILAYLFVSPFILAFLLFQLGPDIYSFVLSFYHYKGYGTATPVGFSNYLAVLQYHVFWQELGNTIFYWLAHALPLIPLSFLLAMLVRSKFIKGQSFWKPVIFLPQVIATVASALVFQALFSTEYGIVNQLLHTKIHWLQDYALARWAIIFLLIWRGLGFWFVVFLAGLSSIDPSLEEAAIVDGATLWQRIRYVIVPLMSNVFLFAFVIDAIGSLRLFAEANVLVSGAGQADPSVAPMLNLLVGNLQNGEFGQSAAIGWILFVLTILVAALQFSSFRASRNK
ncbi:sugar ABC transporter permease [Ktedonosporobacter rubrisoli]|uniref:Sugar ABC transporter permease n=1 Tax=Ktedonosporobacter rubrisoli TaxID=2509675 RepID=A0A4P6K4T0_KTERU|nr:sugar ABC transporter permease [Ktedonosporobacter rubrisoli]QBD82850.1 sugar ABC transporter permease [Ktedonosporobacter rubrisoli]